MSPLPHSKSALGEKLTGRSGILELMDDLGKAMTSQPDMLMLGGGNPAPVPAMQTIIRQRMVELMSDGAAFERMIGNYDPPQGNPAFCIALADLLRRSQGWDISARNIAVTSGGQTAFFYLFNLLAGPGPNGKNRKVLLPIAPEYIGYADQGIAADLFVACQPAITWPKGEAAGEFKYEIDFAAVKAALSDHEIAAIAVSRPTNPSGNVLSDAEIAMLSQMAADRGIPLIIDNAYGAPFPNVIFTDAQPHWAPHVILTMSLSKLGLPGTRTAVVIAPEQIASDIASMTAICGLANGNVGQQLALPWLSSGAILRFGPEILRPYYAAKSAEAQQIARRQFAKVGLRAAIHASEGAFFHWLWFPELRIPSRELYERLKQRKVLVVPGEYFFFGLQEDWAHSQQCLRINYSGSPEVIAKGLRIIAEEAAIACGG
jgi:valine--pyruvate aminotransferase